MSYALKKGTTSKILLVYGVDATDMRSGKTGLSSGTPDSSAAYIREGEAQVRRIHLVAYDPQDADRLGMSALGPEGRRAALRGAFPRLTAKELGEAGEVK